MSTETKWPQARKIRITDKGDFYTVNETGEILPEKNARLKYSNGKIYADKTYMAYYIYKSGIFNELAKNTKDKKLRSEILSEDGIETYKVFNSKGKIVLNIFLKFTKKLFSGNRLDVTSIITADEINAVTNDELKYRLKDLKNKIMASRLVLLEDPLIRSENVKINFKFNV